jgi:general secretion pathway protein B
MSFILDALKKSEAERQRQAGPVLFEAPIARPRRGVPTWVIAAGALLVLANLLGLLWLMLRQPPVTVAAVTSAPTPAATTTANAPVAVVAAAPTANASTVEASADNGSADSTLLALPEVPEDARIASLKHYGTLGSSAPALRLDLHVYSSNPAERYALINMRKLREGETNEDGIVVKEITRSGVVLRYHGEELLLARD